MSLLVTPDVYSGTVIEEHCSLVATCGIYPNSSCNELFELVFPLLVSKLLGVGVHEPVVVLVQRVHVDVWDLGHHGSQLHVARTLRQRTDRETRRLKEMHSPEFIVIYLFILFIFWNQYFLNC